MRQGGMKPKNHKSGVYWTRANANSGPKQKLTEQLPNKSTFPLVTLGWLLLVVLVCLHGCFGS